MQERRRPSVQGGAQKEEKLLIHLENHRGGEKITWNQNKFSDKFLQMEDREKPKSGSRLPQIKNFQDNGGREVWELHISILWWWIW